MPPAGISLPDKLLCVLGPGGFFEAVSDDLCTFLAETRQQLMARPVLRLVHPEDRARAMRELLAQRRTIRAIALDLRFATGNSGWRCLSWQITYDPSSRRHVGIVCDASERVASAEALRKSHERLAFVLDATGDAVWDCDLLKGEVTHNRRWIEMLGFSDSQLVHPVSFFVDLIHPDDRPAIQHRIEECLQTGKAYQAEFRMRHADGHYLWISDHGRIVAWTASGEPARMVGALSDITESKGMLEQLRLQTDALANMSEGICLAGRDGHILYANRTFEQMFGYQPGELIGKHPSILNSPSGGDPEGVARQIIESLNRHGSWAGEVLNRHRDGSDFWTSATVTAFLHETFGKVWLTVQKDINETKLLREERDVAHQQLEQFATRIQEQSEQLRQELAREVHDDIGAVLTGLRIQTSNIAKQASLGQPPGPHDYARLLQGIDAATESTRSLCTRLRPPILDDLGLIETCRWYVRTWSEQSGIRSRIRLGSPMAPPGEALSIDIFRVLQELLTNVARHANANQVYVSLNAAGHTLRLRVKDNGQGFQGKSSGLGLMGVRERLRRHGGWMNIESGPDGSTVTVTARLAQ